MEFVRKFERQCSSQASVKRLRVHPSYTSFHNKWNLPVYFQLRCVLPQYDLYCTYQSQYILHYVQRTSPASLLYTFHTMIVQLCGGEICAKVLTSSLFICHTTRATLHINSRGDGLEMYLLSPQSNNIMSPLSLRDNFSLCL